MATRPVYMAKEKEPFFEMVEVDFPWNGGLAITQKQKNIRALHGRFLERHPGKNVLEISSKSMQEYGEALSAFFLPKYVPELDKRKMRILSGLFTMARGNRKLMKAQMCLLRRRMQNQKQGWR